MLAFVLWLIPAMASAGAFSSESFTLENGLQVIVIPNHRAPVVSNMIWYKVGASDEAHGHSGVAHFLEHLMFKGTPRVPEGMFSKIVKRHGGNDNAFTSQDYTAFFQNIAKDKLDMVLEMEADRMQNLALTAAAVTSERAVILEERRQVIDSNPSARFGEEIRNLLFVNHPYGTPTIGWMHEMAALTQDDAISFYKKWYVPNNAILIIAGDVTAQEVKPLVEKHFGKIPSKPVPERVRPVSPPVASERRAVMRDPQVREPVLYIAYRAPGAHLDLPASFALQVFSEIMSGGASSRLYRSLVVEQKLATSVSLSYTPFSLDMSSVQLQATPAPETSLEDLELAALGEIEKLAVSGVTEEELATAKESLVAEATYARDSLQDPAQLFGYAVTTGLDVAYVENWQDGISAVTAQQVQEAAQKFLIGRNNAPVIGYMLPDADTEEQPAGSDTSADPNTGGETQE